MKKIMWAISCVSLVGTAAVLQFMPDRVPMHYDIAGNIDRWGSKYENLIFPVIIIILSLFMTVLTGHYEKKAIAAMSEKKRAEAGSNVRVLGIAGALLAAMFTIMQAFILCGSYREAVSGADRQAVDMGKVAVILLGVMMIVLGNFMPKTRSNSAVGFRMRWSMFNDTTWQKSNRFGAFAIIAAGILTVLLAVLIKSSLAAMIAALGLIAVAAIATAVYSHKVYIREVGADRGEE